jgi:gas vesicle protein
VGQEPDRIRAEIEQTRADMSETVEALGHKADLKSRAKQNLQGKKDSAKESIVGVKESIVGAGASVSDRTPDSDEVKHKAKKAASVAQENPLGLAIGAVAVGFIAGMLIPSTRVEDEKLGGMADDVKAKVKETGSEALEHGKQVAQDAAQTVKESGQEHAQQVKESAQDEGSSRATDSVSTAPASPAV